MSALPRNVSGMDLRPLIAASMLTIEGTTYIHSGVKESVIRQAFDVTTTRYFQMVNALINSELALQLDAPGTYRLRRIRSERQRSRSLRSA